MAMAVVDDLIKAAALAARSKPLDCMDYERYKLALVPLHLDEEQHEAAIKSLIAVMGLWVGAGSPWLPSIGEEQYQVAMHRLVAVMGLWVGAGSPWLPSIIKAAALAARSKPLDCMDYERYKLALVPLHLDEEQHEAAIKSLVAVMGLWVGAGSPWLPSIIKAALEDSPLWDINKLLKAY